MPAQEILKYLRQAPFLAFRIYLSNGAVHDVRHPELVILGRGILSLHFPPTGLSPGISERTYSVSLIHVVQLELI